MAGYSRMNDMAMDFAYAWCRINNLDPYTEYNWERAMDWVMSNSVSVCENYIREHEAYMDL